MSMILFCSLYVNSVSCLLIFSKGIWATTLANEKKLNRAFKVSFCCKLCAIYYILSFCSVPEMGHAEPQFASFFFFFFSFDPVI